jgi:tetratricopeptide (TPR) repeat protein
LLALNALVLIENHDSAIAGIEEALSIAQELAARDLTVEALNQKGNYLQRSGKADQAMAIYDSALNMALTDNYEKGLAKVYNNIALIHVEKGDFAKAF